MQFFSIYNSLRFLSVMLFLNVSFEWYYETSTENYTIKAPEPYL